MRLRRFASVLVCAAATSLAGCFQSSTLVRLNPDGSGTIEQTLSMTAQAMSQLQSFAATGGKDATGKANDLFSVDEAKTAVTKMGDGVTFVSAEKIDAADRKGIKAIYAFKDIRTLAVREMNMPAGAGTASRPEQPMSLSFTQLPNGHALLAIRNADVAKDLTAPPVGGAGSSPLGGADNPQSAEMMKMLLAGMKIDFAIQVGHVVRTNTPYVTGGTVTLVSIDFDQILASPGALEKMQAAKTPAETKAALQGVKGIKVNLDPELTIEFTK